MTVLTEATGTEPTVDSVMGQILVELGSSVGLLLSALGMRTGLWAALAESGPLTPPELSERTGVVAPLAREWLRAQAAAGYLRYDPSSGRFRLPEAVAAAMLQAPGGAMIDACTSMLCSMGAGFAEFTQAFRGNGGYGWVRRSEEYLDGSDLLTRAALPPELIGAILDQVDTNLASGGSIADVCCGYASPTLAVASHFPAARVLGIDYSDVSVAHARSSAESVGLSQRVRFEVAAATDLPGSGYGLITFFDALHKPRGSDRRTCHRPRGARAGWRGPARGSERRRPCRRQPEPGGAHVLFDFDAGVHAECLVPASTWRSRAVRHPGG